MASVIALVPDRVMFAVRGLGAVAILRETTASDLCRSPPGSPELCRNCGMSAPAGAGRRHAPDDTEVNTWNCQELRDLP